jgi:hypothetical protein
VIPQTEDVIKSNLHDGEAVLLDRRSAFYYWTKEPSSNVIDVYAENWAFFQSADDLRHFVDTLNIKVAGYSSQTIIDQLKTIGFTEIAHDSDMTVLKRN